MTRAIVVSFAAAILLWGCGDGGAGGAAGPTPCPLPETRGNGRLLPRDLQLDGYGVLAETKVSKGFVSARIVSETEIVELYPPIARSLLDNGYQILSGDNEGFEAEIFFTRGKDANGNIYMREGPCTGQVTMTLTYGSAGGGGKRER